MEDIRILVVDHSFSIIIYCLICFYLFIFVRLSFAISIMPTFLQSIQ